ncbi:MAG: hypothetical protein ACRCZ8_12940, partial [Aeromonas sobria]
MRTLAGRPWPALFIAGIYSIAGIRMGNMTMNRTAMGGCRAIPEEQNRGGGVAVGTIRGGAQLATLATEDVGVLNFKQKKSPPEWGFFSETLLQISAFS